ncbi:hypothetical protein IU500_12415 [Nocardia terpenica]|uniref:hypothetical protein n=1 Tax=Nocardia terpenica TaxID=455432 RepID=UPI0018941DE7|nr:hypothetical protein [Nocardia terpenica]MBF6063019.1 hypothetical protein [Nocardia terpenica]MBF6104846.1 hypothetical protein [Nocardia terpenica]MBF6112717.1 hypothetical protein [Nocardia terpenica]MBF6118574.1 hypothetical protein [Nocardia terpenica]MBF6155053.1 hypothetical protein [Nocardia terpenica]
MRFRPDYAGMADYLKTSPDLRSVLTHQAEIVMALYRDNVRKKSGRNAREVRMSTRLGGIRSDRWIAAVHAYSPYAAYREWGTKRNPAERGLQHALEELKDI